MEKMKEAGIHVDVVRTTANPALGSHKSGVSDVVNALTLQEVA